MNRRSAKENGKDGWNMNKRIITISREFGSGGHTIGKTVAEELGIAFYDQELLEHIAEETGFSREFIKSAAEDSTANYSLLFNMVVNRSFQLRNEPTPADTVFFAQMKIIQNIAEQEECVIVGRCSDYILRDRKDCLNVFIHADEKSKLKRAVKYYNVSEKDAPAVMKKKDKARYNHYKYYTDQEWGMASNYDLCLNSGLLGIEGCVKVIQDVLNKFAD